MLTGAHNRDACPYFDRQSESWILHTYNSVMTALHSDAVAVPGSDDAPDPERSAETRRRLSHAFGGVRLLQLQQCAQKAACALLNELPAGYAIDIIGRFARPLALQLAGLVVHADPGELHRLAVLAAAVSAAAARTDDPDVARRAACAGEELDALLKDSHLPMPGPAFVAISQTLPCFLANAWFRLFQETPQIEQLQRTPLNYPALVEEMLRTAGLARSVTRVTIKDVTIANCHIRKGERLTILLQAANSDPAQFAEPQRFDPFRRPNNHVALGAGVHACPGANLIRMAASVATCTVLTRLQRADASQHVRWQGGAGFRWPEPLWVALRPGVSS